MSYPMLAYEVVEWVIRLVMLGVVPYHRKPVSALAWLAIIFFLPVPGLILFLLIGGYRIPRRRIERHRELLRGSNPPGASPRRVRMSPARN